MIQIYHFINTTPRHLCSASQCRRCSSTSKRPAGVAVRSLNEDRQLSWKQESVSHLTILHFLLLNPIVNTVFDLQLRHLASFDAEWLTCKDVMLHHGNSPRMVRSTPHVYLCSSAQQPRRERASERGSSKVAHSPHIKIKSCAVVVFLMSALGKKKKKKKKGVFINH